MSVTKTSSTGVMNGLMSCYLPAASDFPTMESLFSNLAPFMSSCSELQRLGADFTHSLVHLFMHSSLMFVAPAEVISSQQLGIVFMCSCLHAFIC